MTVNTMRNCLTALSLTTILTMVILAAWFHSAAAIVVAVMMLFLVAGMRIDILLKGGADGD